MIPISGYLDPQSLVTFQLPKDRPRVKLLGTLEVEAINYPEGPSTQYFRTLVPNTMKGMGFGTRWVLGPFGLKRSCSGSMPRRWLPSGGTAARRRLKDRPSHSLKVGAWKCIELQKVPHTLRSKVPKHEVYMVSTTGIVIMVWGIYASYLGAWTLRDMLALDPNIKCVCVCVC